MITKTKTESKKRNFEDYPDILRPSDLIDILACSRNKIWEIMNTPNFPKIKFGRVIRIPKDSFIKWLEENCKA